MMNTLHPIQMKSQRILGPCISLPLPELGKRAIDCLLRLSQPQSDATDCDRKLVLELLSIAGDADPSSASAMLQRIGMVDLMFSQLLSEPYLPPSCRKLLEPLRFALIKNALVDIDLLTQLTHPLRQMLHDTLLAATSSCIKGEAGLRRIEARLGELPALIDLSANFVSLSVPAMQGLSTAQVTAFSEQLTAQAVERRLKLENAVCSSVGRELEEMTFDLKLPPGVITFVKEALNPLLTFILLKHGMDSLRWTAGMARVQSLLASFEPANAGRARDRSGLLGQMALDLTSIGMPHERMQKLLALLNNGGIPQQQYA